MKGKISIHLVHDSINGDFIEILIEDRKSGTQFTEIEMSLEAFTLAITGMTGQPCTFELRGIEHIGKSRQWKKCLVPYIPTHDGASLSGRMEKRRILAPYEVEGWRGNDSDLGNYHKRNSENEYTVTFQRFVDGGNSQETSEDENG